MYVGGGGEEAEVTTCAWEDSTRGVVVVGEIQLSKSEGKKEG